MSEHIFQNTNGETATLIEECAYCLVRGDQYFRFKCVYPVVDGKLTLNFEDLRQIHDRLIDEIVSINGFVENVVEMNIPVSKRHMDEHHSSNGVTSFSSYLTEEMKHLSIHLHEHSLIFDPPLPVCCLPFQKPIEILVDINNDKVVLECVSFLSLEERVEYMKKDHPISDELIIKEGLFISDV